MSAESLSSNLGWIQPWTSATFPNSFTIYCVVLYLSYYVDFDLTIRYQYLYILRLMFYTVANRMWLIATILDSRLG